MHRFDIVMCSLSLLCFSLLRYINTGVAGFISKVASLTFMIDRIAFLLHSFGYHESRNILLSGMALFRSVRTDEGRYETKGVLWVLILGNSARWADRSIRYSARFLIRSIRTIW